MFLGIYAFFLLPIWITLVVSDFLGPTYPAPKDLTSDESLVSAAWANLSKTMSSYLNGSQSMKATTASGVANLTFSTGMFSLHDPAAADVLQFHHTAHEVETSPRGAHEVDGDSIYRVASVTKLFTVFAGMLNLKDSDWDRPITEVIPGLAEYTRNALPKDGPALTIQWDQVTLANLGAQISGVARDVQPFLQDIVFQNETIQELGGLPPLTDYNDPNIISPCLAQGLFGNCTGALFGEGERARPPVFLPWTNPAYSDNGLMLLGLAIENFTGRSLDEIYSDSIFGPLGMDSSFSLTPPNDTSSRWVQPGDAPNPPFILDAGISRFSGGIFSTLNDLAKFSTGVLNSTQLPTDVTRKWMKPISHTAHLWYSVGRPWEIYRYVHPSGKTTDLYTKLGDSGDYGGQVVLIPDYDAGFNILGTSTSRTRGDATYLVEDMITYAMLPALEAQAKAEAGRNLAGRYVSTIEGLNSSLTLAINDRAGAPTGLVVTEWISNGTDFLASVKNYFAYDPLRIVPTIPDQGSGQVAFRHSNVVEAEVKKEGVAGLGLFTGQLALNLDWLTVDSMVSTYGGYDLFLFVFDVEDDGRASAITLPGLRVKLERRRE